MSMLANHLGYTQLAVPVRFTEEWERDASLRLRQGDKTALDAYAEHGRILGGSRDEALDVARRGYVARRLAGEDALLMAYSREDCRELSRVIRDDLIHLGLVDDGPSVQISDGERASAGDVIVCRENDSRRGNRPRPQAHQRRHVPDRKRRRHRRMGAASSGCRPANRPGQAC